MIIIKYDILEFIDDNISIELFGKNKYRLKAFEISMALDYMHDINTPIWKSIMIDGKESGYYISNTGEIKGKRGNILKKDISNTGYYVINGYNKKPIKLRIHREVAEKFIPNPEGKPFVNHINGNKLCNWYKNLEWVTHLENMTHASNTGLILKGVNHPENIYSEKTIREACKMLENPNNKLIDIERKTGINRSILYSIRTKHSWVDISKDYNIPLPKKQDKFDNEKIKLAAELLYNSNLSYAEITKITDIPLRTLIKIKHKSKGYKWLFENIKNME